jgi:PPOX class probable FMN-dependent enzyme
MARITSHEELRRHYREPTDRVLRKELDHLDAHCRLFIERSPFLILATAGADGRVDASPRGDHPGFVQAADRHTLLIPDRPGNNRLDSLTNLVERPGAAVIFVIPGVDETLRVNGSIAIDDDRDLRQRFAVAGRIPATVLVMRAEQVYLHCAKAFMRSSLWDPESWPAIRPVPTLGEMIHDQIGEVVAAETQDEMVARYRQSLY